MFQRLIQLNKSNIIYYLLQLLICENILLRLFSLFVLFSITSTGLRHLDENLNIFCLHSIIIEYFTNLRTENRNSESDCSWLFLHMQGQTFPPGIPPPSCSPCYLLTAKNITHIYHQRSGKKDKILYAALFDIKWVLPAQRSA